MRRWLWTRISWSQFLEWSRYAEEEPFGETRADLRAGIVTAMIRNVNTDTRKSKPASPADFMPSFGSARRRKNKSTKPLTDPVAWKRFADRFTSSFGEPKQGQEQR